MLILDTDVVSALRRQRSLPRVAAWLRAQAERELHLSAITVGELERGVTLKRRRDPAAAALLEAWLEDTLLFFADRVIPFGREEARIWGRLSAEIGHDGADLQIAATALARGAVVATRNVRHFQPAGVAVVDPFGG